MAGEDIRGLLQRLGGGSVQTPPAPSPAVSDVSETSTAVSKTTKPITPNPFRHLPAPDPVPVEFVESAADLSALVERWLAAPPELVGLDLETTGLTPLLGAKVRTVQMLASGDGACHVIDTWAVGSQWPALLAPLFRLPSITWVAHNALFEVEHLAAAGIRFLSPLRCTYAAEYLLSRGVLPIVERVSAQGSGLDLASCCGRHLQVDVDKAPQVSDWGASTLSPEQIAYAAMDARLALDLWDVQRHLLDASDMLRVHQIESQALPAVAEARLTGLRLDLPKAEALLEQGQANLQALASHLAETLGVANVNSQRQVAAALEARGHSLPTTAAGNKSVAEEVLRPLYEKDAGLDPLKKHRAVQKNVRTYLQNWVALAKASPELRIYPQLRAIGAVTGRMSCPRGALPKPTTLHGVPSESDLRSLFVAAPGHLLVDGDWSAIEHRLAAAIYGEAAYVAIYSSDDPDPHSHTASAIYGRPITKADREERAVGKTANFCLQYGGGPKRLQAQLSQAFNREVPLTEARRVCDGWARAYPAIAAIRDRHRQQEPWEVRSAMGRLMADQMDLPAVPGESFAGAKPARMRSTNALAYPIQASGAELLKEALGLLMPRLWAELPGVRLCHVIHDEIVLEAPEELAQAAADLLLEVMQAPELEERYLRGVLPLVAEVKVGRTWADTH